MVVLNKIYTRTGDAGTTALGSGERVSKSHARIAAFGTVDETNSSIGVARAQLRGSKDSRADMADMDARLARVQNDLFDLGADLCVPERSEKPDYDPLRISEIQVKWLENQIDAMNSDMQPLRSFVLPGGNGASAALHLARTICRRAERKIVELAALPGETVSDAAVKYVNRLSDFLFVAARHVNNCGRDDILWVPGENR